MYNDYELLYLAQENNEDAIKILRKKYNSLLHSKALSFYKKSQIDIKELLNEAELAFYKAIENYVDKNTFNTFLNKLIDNNLTNYVSKYNNVRNRILNESISYEYTQKLLGLGSNKDNPELKVFSEYNYLIFRQSIINTLTWKEELVFTLKEQNYTVSEISEITDNNLRTVYNIIKRIQEKTIKLMSN